MSEAPRLDDSLVLRLDEVCDRFEAAWAAGQNPRLEDYLGATPALHRAALLRELLLLDVHYRRQSGAAPQAADYQGRFPELEPAWLAQAVAPPAEAGSQASTH